MTLQDFVTETLTQIANGVSTARKGNRQIAPSVAMSTAHGNSYVVFRGGVSNPSAFLVDFDVAVTVSQKKSNDAGGGIAVHVFQAKASREGATEHSTVSRIKFQVPVTFDSI